MYMIIEYHNRGGRIMACLYDEDDVSYSGFGDTEEEAKKKAIAEYNEITARPFKVETINPNEL